MGVVAALVSLRLWGARSSAPHHYMLRSTMADDVRSLATNTVQSRVRQDRAVGLSLMLYLTAGTELVPPWWSRLRDLRLRSFWKDNDYLSGAVYTIESRISTIPVSIVALDENVQQHIELAYEFEEMLLQGAEFGAGWEAFISKWVEDLITQDNGAFAEIIGPGKADGPLTGMPLGIAHLDSARCARTSNPEYPVLYTDTDGQRYKMHFSRVAFASLQPSPIAEMLGVGFSSVSRCINTAQHLLDVLVYKQEKLGSRPKRGMIVTKGGLDPDDINEALAIADEDMDNKRLNKYSQIAVVGHADKPDADMTLVDLASLPDGYDETQSTTIGMAAIALAFGVDPRELWPGLSVGTTRAEALVAHLKARMKGIGQIIQITERALGPKLLPPTLEIVFDFQDDAQDRQVAEIKELRSKRHTVDLTSGLIDLRTARQQALHDDDLTQEQFDMLELNDGRLPDGSSVLSLFYSPEHRTVLDMGVPDVLTADSASLKPLIVTKRAEIMTALGVITDYAQRVLLQQCAAALDALESERTPKPKPRPVVPGESETIEGDVTEISDTEGTEQGETDELESEGDETMGKALTPARAFAMLRSKARELPTYTVKAGEMPPPPIIIQMPEMPVPVVNITTPAPIVNVEAAKAPDVKVDVQAAPAPNVTVQAPSAPVVRLDVKPTPITQQIDVHVPQVEEEVSMIERDRSGLITRIRKMRTTKKRGA